MLEFWFYNMDCMEGMKEFPDKYFDLAIVDPEYGEGWTFKHNELDRPTEKWKNPTSQKYKYFSNSKPPSKEYFLELLRVSKNQIIWGGNYFCDCLPVSRGWIVWDKKSDIREKTFNV